jgi:WD40 repeat protein
MHRIIAGFALAFAMGFGVADDAAAPKDVIHQLRFSPDGRYVLAQNNSEITIVTVRPLSILFRIPAQNAEFAQFTPDSQQVVFVSSGTKVSPNKIALTDSTSHVDRWKIADQTHVDTTTLPMLVCGTEQLSPDGRVLACVDLESTLRLIDVASGQTIFEKKKIASLYAKYDLETGRPRSDLGQLGAANIDFSPDSRFVVVRPENAQGSAFIVNVHERTVLELSGALKKIRNDWSAWMGPDRLLVLEERWNYDNFKRGLGYARVIAFPSGKALSEWKVPSGYFYKATDPDFILIRPFGRMNVGQTSSSRTAAVEVSTGMVIISNTLALDVLGHYYVAQSAEQEMGLYEIGKGLKATVSFHNK